MSAKPKPPTVLPTDNDLRAVVAFNVRLLRVGKGWSQEKLALECGLDRSYVSAVERSRWNVSLSNIEAIAKALEVQPYFLLKPPSSDAISGQDLS